MAWRAINDYGIRIAHRTYDAPELGPWRPRRGVILSGASGTGKTTALTQLGRAHELATRKRHPHDRARLPVVYVTVPPAATPKMLASEFARFFGLTFPPRATHTDIVDAVCATAAPFSYATTGDNLFHRAGGMIGSLSRLVRGAAVLATEDGSEAITEKLLELVPIDFAAEQSEQLTAPAKATGAAEARCLIVLDRVWRDSPGGVNEDHCLGDENGDHSALMVCDMPHLT